MAAKTIVRGSMDYINELTASPKWEVVTVGVSSGSPDVETDDCGTFALFNLPANIMILNVRASVQEAFTASTTINIGDSDDTDGMLATAKLGCTTASSTLKVNAAVGYFDMTGFKQGVHYSASGQVINALVAGATPAAGKATVAIEYLLV